MILKMWQEHRLAQQLFLIAPNIGKAVTISFGVSILVHDFSIVHATRSIGKKTNAIIYKRVKIGNNVFIGAKSTILPGSTIGDNCIVGGKKQ